MRDSPEIAGDLTSVEGRARRIAARAHTGQVDRLGRPMYEHVCGVATMARSRLDVLGSVLGFLHDAIEKGGLTRETLAADGFNDTVLDLIEILTRGPGDADDAYLERCAADPRTAIVKELDLLEKISAARRINDDNARHQQARWEHLLRRLRELAPDHLHRGRRRAMDRREDQPTRP